MTTPSFEKSYVINSEGKPQHRTRGSVQWHDEAALAKIILVRKVSNTLRRLGGQSAVETEDDQEKKGSSNSRNRHQQEQ